MTDHVDRRSLELFLLGPMEARVDGRAVSVSGARRRALLIRLALSANEMVSKDRLIDDIWGEFPPPTAVKSLQVQVSQLRDVLRVAGGVPAKSDELLVTGSSGYMLRLERDSLDTSRFEQASSVARQALAQHRHVDAAAICRSALSLWRGPPLLDVSQEPFAAAEIARLDELRLGIFEMRIEADLAQSDHVPIVGELETLVAGHPLREHLWWLLALALYRSGRQAEAVRACTRLREILRDELGLDPSAEITMLEHQIIVQDPALEFDAASAGDGSVGIDNSIPSVQPAPGVYAFLFTDLEDSTPQWERHPTQMAAAVARHDDIVRAAVRGHAGQVFSTGGDGFAVVFPTPAQAVEAGLQVHRTLATERWPVEVTIQARMAVHAGTAQSRDANFFGTEVNRTARLAAAANGGQLVLSQAAADLARDNLEPGAELVDLGEYSLKGLTRPERVYQLVVPGLDGPRGRLRVPRKTEGNLPAPVTTFIGRRRELAELTDELQAHRIVSLVGAGGVGKTRLAVEAAHQMNDHFTDGIWLCELAPVSSSADVAYAVAAVLGARPEEGRSVSDALVDHLKGRRALLLVDNCEHVLDAAAALVANIAAGCPTVAVLATSREPLAVQGERVWTLGGLDVAVDAPALFWERVSAADEAHTVTAEDTATVEDICTHLDGLPLGIELAAARARTMTLADLAARLDDRFRFLRGPARDRPGRHQTLLAAIDWSYRLLSEDERSLFDRLSVFPGTFDAAAVAPLCSEPPLGSADTDDLLHQLADKSVVVADRTGSTTRFLLLETLRHYGAGHLTNTDRQHLEQSFARHYLRAAQDARAQLVSSAAGAGRAWFQREWHNIRAAIQFAVAAGDQATVVAVLDSVRWYAEATGVVEVGAWAETAVVRFGDHPALLGTAAFFATQRGDNDKAKTLAEIGLAATDDDDDPDTRLCWQALQTVHWYGGNPSAALDAQLKVIALTDPVADPFGAAYGYAIAGGTSAFIGGTEGQQWLDESARLAAPLHNPTLDMLHTFMGASHAFGEGRLDDALAGFQQAAGEASVCGAEVWGKRALMVQVSLAQHLNRTDVRAVLHDILAQLHSTLSWSDVYSTLETVLGMWTTERRLADAGIILGFLEANHLQHSMAPARAAAAPTVHADQEGQQAVELGRTMERDQLVAYVLQRLSTPA